MIQLDLLEKESPYWDSPPDFKLSPFGEYGKYRGPTPILMLGPDCLETGYGGLQWTDAIRIDQHRPHQPDIFEVAEYEDMVAACHTAFNKAGREWYEKWYDDILWEFLSSPRLPCP